ncbi:MAG: hypothetical protein IT317_12895 [Anaerolineales bacterium]|nr:hypothetical protein [Anaerolineales bacterium]
MRLPRESVLSLGLLTAVCLLGSVVFGIATGRIFAPDAPRATSTPRPTASSFSAGLTDTPAAPAAGASPSPPGRPRSLIIIGVDDAQSPTPLLETVWVLTFQPGVNQYYILAFPPTAQFQPASLSTLQPMSAIFAQDVAQQVGTYNFVRDAIATRFPGFIIAGDIVLDRQDLVGLVTTVGGLSWAGNVVQGADLLSSYDAYEPSDEAGRMQFQQEIMELLFTTLSQQQVSQKALLDYVRQLPQVQTDTGRLIILDEFAVGAPAPADSELTWRTFQPEMEMGAQP